jgi:3-oxoacyl-[acyl-carrier-protein] synthase II
MNMRRVVATGIGAVCPVGVGNEQIWQAVRDGLSGIGLISSFDTSDFEVHIAGEVTGFDPLAYFSKRELQRLDRFVQFAMVAAKQAVAQAQLNLATEDRTRIGTYIGTGIGGLETIEAQHARLLAGGPGRTSPLMIPKLMTNAASGQVAMHMGLLGPSMSCSSACASASHAIGEALQSIRHGMADVQLCGGSEAAITPMGLSGFQQMKALSTRNDQPTAASRPFDANRDGFVMSEGAAILVLEELGHAQARDAPILAELCGYGASSDAYHITLPEPDGRGAARAMSNALADAAMTPDRIDYINAHGTGTPAGDDVEAKAIVSVFGEQAATVPVSSTKSVFGHLLGASGALESAVCLWALQEGVCPPTINLIDPDPECCGLNFVPLVAQKHELNAVLNNSFGFGGHNVSLIFCRFVE